MAFFNSKPDPIKDLERSLSAKQTAREKLAGRLSAAEVLVAESCKTSEQLAIADAPDADLDRAESATRAAEDRLATLRAAMVQIDQQIAEVERTLREAREQAQRDEVATAFEKMASDLKLAFPAFDDAVAKLAESITSSPASMEQATRFAGWLNALRVDVNNAANLIHGEVLTAARRARDPTVNIRFLTPDEPEPPLAESAT